MNVTTNSATGYQAVAASTSNENITVKKSDTPVTSGAATGTLEQDTVTLSPEAKSLQLNSEGEDKAQQPLPAENPQATEPPAEADARTLGDVLPPWPPGTIK